MEKWVKVFFKRARVKNIRSLFVIVGVTGVKQIPKFYELISKDKNPSVLFCSSNPAIFRNEKLGINGNFEEVRINPKIAYLSYSEIQDEIYQSHNLAILHNVEDAEPSSIAYIIEAVKGGGAVIFLFDKVKTLDELVDPSKESNLTKSRFIRRLCATFKASSSCLILNSNLEVLSHPKDITSFKDLKNVSPSEDLLEMKSDNIADPVIGPLVNLCQTTDQINVLLKFIDVLNKRTFHSTVSVSSPKGRGKSAALGLAIAASLALNYSNIFISSLNYENVKIIFRFLFKGLDVLNYKEDEDYDLIQSINPKFKNALLGINVFKNHPQAVRFILPGDVENKLEQAELVVIDEAAAIPWPLLNRLLGSYIVLMASTVEGCGGTGKFLYKRMVREISQPTSVKDESKVFASVTLFPATDKSFEKTSLNEPILYAKDDEVESWVSQLLCLESSLTATLSQGCPVPQQCQLFYINQDVLFSYENHAENFLQQVTSLFLSSKRNISPDILSKMADVPGYHIFCLLAPFNNAKNTNPEILCAILVHTEKQVPTNIIYSGINQEENCHFCFNEWQSICKDSEEFSSKCGIHIVDIVTHPEYTRMKYGLRSLALLQEFYENKWIPIDDKPFVYSCVNKAYNHHNKDSTAPLLLQLSEVEPQKVDYILVSYFLSSSLLNFWKKSKFVPVYISKEKNSALEHSCLMLKALDKEFQAYLQESWRCFCESYFLLLSVELKSLPSSFALNILKSSITSQLPKKVLTKEDIDIYLNPKRMKALEKYCQNLSDLHCIMPCIPVLTKLYFRGYLSSVVLPVLQEVILLSFGLQRRTIDEISKDLGLPSSQVHGLLNRTIRKLTNCISGIIEVAVEKTIKSCEVNMEPLAQDLDDELEEAAKNIKQQQLEQSTKLMGMDFSQYAIKGSEDDWEKALHSGRKTLVSIKSLKKAPEDVEFPVKTKNPNFKKKKQHMKRKR